MLGLLFSIYGDDPPRQTAGLALGILGIIALGLALMPEPVQWSHLFCEVLWSAAAALAISGLGGDLSTEAAQVDEQLAQADEEAISRAFADGRAAVAAMVARAGRRVRQAFEESRSVVLPSTAAELEVRLDEMDRRLGGLGLESGDEPA